MMQLQRERLFSDLEHERIMKSAHRRVLGSIIQSEAWEQQESASKDEMQ
jgi:hypothetical protein